MMVGASPSTYNPTTPSMIQSRIYYITDILPREQHRWMFACGDDVAPLNDDLLCDYVISDAGSDDITDAQIPAVTILTVDFEHRRLDESGHVYKKSKGSADVEQ